VIWLDQDDAHDRIGEKLRSGEIDAREAECLRKFADDGYLIISTGVTAHDAHEFDASVEMGPFGSEYEPVDLVRPPFRGTAWARGVAEMAASIDAGRPHRASAELAAHIVDIIDAARASMAEDGRAVKVASTFAQPELMPWTEAGSVSPR